ncbi:PaaX family transcriptional regulator C-terminal domain-containing protein [Sedimentitalea sp. HM32M-2]|uniref:PaaX family transcriptional regulator C-terminal domain-containing protein n=1 Tax=Sedimentitalea sp. HM32M-2 TaxID=3351566 RepID=UPI0036D26CFA
MIITVFGDLVQHRGGEISTARLRALLGRVGVEQGTLRTALSRLGSDGWVHSERNGRTSLYRLSRQGIERFAPATTRIYAAPRTAPVTKWAAVLTLAGTGAQSVRICPADEAPAAADCRIVGDLAQVSDAYRATTLSPDHRQALAALAADLAALQRPVTTPLDAAAARLLLIHRWRRIVLRYPDPVPDLMPADAPLTDPRAEVARAYRALTPAAEVWLSQADDGLSAMPDPVSEVENRFGNMQQT